MSYSDCDLPSFYDVREVKAKKTHHCCECSAPILVGEAYTYCLGKWSGDFQCYKQHNLCANACRWIRDQSDDGCIAFGSLKEWFHEDRRYSEKNHPKTVEIRNMMAKIFKRERSS